MKSKENKKVINEKKEKENNIKRKKIFYKEEVKKYLNLNAENNQYSEINQFMLEKINSNYIIQNIFSFIGEKKVITILKYFLI